MVPSLFRYPVPPAALASPDPDTIHHAAPEVGICTTQGRVLSMNAELQIFNQYSLSTAIYSGKLNKMKHLCCFVKSKM